MLAFVDMETTGLDAREEVPLEVGITLTDDFGQQIIAEKKWLVFEDSVHYHTRIDAAKAHSIVGPMHEESGLWDDLFAFRSLTRWEVDKEVVRWLADQGMPKGEIPMAGNSTGSLDRPFTLVHFPKLNEFLHYRNVDMSSIKEICKRVNPELFDNLRAIVENKEAAMHRVLDDNRACIREYRAYLDNFLIVGD